LKAEVENKILINEYQLGEQLSHCIHSKRRSDFSLMLAMLTDDVREHSQFNRLFTEEIGSMSKEQQLRKEFNLPPKVDLALKEPHDLSCFNQATKIVNKQLASIHLDNYLNPSPIAFRDNVKHISSEVINNTSIHCQARRKNNGSGKRPSFDANVWLDAIQTAMVKAPLLTV